MKRILLATFLCALSFQQTLQGCAVQHPVDTIHCPQNKVWDGQLSRCRCPLMASCIQGSVWDNEACKCVSQAISNPLPVDQACP